MKPDIPRPPHKRFRTSGILPPVCAAVSLLLLGCASGDKRGFSTGDHWRVPASGDFSAKIPPPPRQNSPAALEGVREILDLQARATPRKIASARWTYEFSVFSFSLALGPSFTAKNYPQTAKLFRRLNSLVQRVNTPLKDHFRAPHPFQVDKRVKRFVDAVPGYDYPSYHAARCAVFQRVLSVLDPGQHTKFEAVSARVEEDRVFAGEHFRYSIEAGRRLGEQIFQELQNDQRFRRDVLKLKGAEWTPAPDSRNSF